MGLSQADIQAGQVFLGQEYSQPVVMMIPAALALREPAEPCKYFTFYLSLA